MRRSDIYLNGLLLAMLVEWLECYLDSHYENVYTSKCTYLVQKRYFTSRAIMSLLYSLAKVSSEKRMIK